MLKQICVYVVWFAALVVATPAMAEPDLTHINSGGGFVVAAPVNSGQRSYVAAGQTIMVWHMIQDGPPVLVGTTGTDPLRGRIWAMALVGQYLYASWYDANAYVGGIAIYTLADPDHPHAIATFDDYIAGNPKLASAMMVSNNLLYIADVYQGVVVADVSDPLNPKAGPLVDATPGIEQLAQFGSRMIAVWRNPFTFSPGISVFDVEIPESPALLGTAEMPYAANFILSVDANYVVAGLADRLSVYDLSDPTQIAIASETANAATFGGVMDATELQLITENGAQGWDFADPAHPTLVASNTMPIQGVFTAAATRSASGLLLLSTDDRGHVIDMHAESGPALSASFLLPGGMATRGAASEGNHVYVAQALYGFSEVSDGDLMPIERFDPTLPHTPGSPDVRGVAVQDGYAYMVNHQTGVVIADLHGTAGPVEASRFDLPKANVVQVDDGLAFVGTAVNHASVTIINVVDPNSPALVQTISTNRVSIDAIVKHGDLLYFIGTPGTLYIADVTNPHAPVIQSTLDVCTTISFRISADGRTIFVPCPGNPAGMLVVDVTSQSNPQIVGTYAQPEGSGATSVSVSDRGDRVYLGHYAGLDEIDVADPANPVRTAEHVIGPVIYLTSAAGGLLYADGGPDGMHVFSSDSIYRDGFE